MWSGVLLWKEHVDLREAGRAAPALRSPSPTVAAFGCHVALRRGDIGARAPGAVMLKKDVDEPQRWGDTEIRAGSMIGDADELDKFTLVYGREAKAEDGTLYTVLCEEFKVGWLDPFSSLVGWLLRLDKRGEYTKGRNKVPREQRLMHRMKSERIQTYLRDMLAN